MPDAGAISGSNAFFHCLHMQFACLPNATEASMPKAGLYLLQAVSLMLLLVLVMI